MDVLRKENARLRRKVEADNKEKEKENTENTTSIHKIVSHLRIINEKEGDSSYHTTLVTEGATNTSLMVGSPSHNWKSLTVEGYDGSTYPDEHIDIYVTRINLYSTQTQSHPRFFLQHLRDKHLFGSPTCCLIP